MDRLMDKQDVVYIYVYGILLGHRKNEIMPFAATWVGPLSYWDYHTEWRKSDKDKYMISHICRIEKNDTNELKK